MPETPVFYKNPGVATVLSFLWMGLGQLYNGRIGKGIVFCLIYAVAVGLSFCYKANMSLAVFATIVAIILWIIGMVDANKEAKRINAQLSSQSGQGGAR